MMRKWLTILLLLVTFVVSAQDVGYRSSDSTDGNFWMRLTPLQKELVVFGFVQGVRSFSFELTNFWNIDTTGFERRWNEPPRQFTWYIERVDNYYRETGNYQMPIWKVLFSHGDEAWINEYEYQEGR